VAGESAAEDFVVGEPRWPMASAVVAAIVLTILMPDDLRLGPNWLLPFIVSVLLVALIAGDPGRIDRRTALLRTLSVGLIAVLVFSALWSTVVLTDHLINGGKETDSAEALLEAGSIVWGSNIIAFALLYWELDGGGAAERAHRPSSRSVDLAFPQHMSPELAPAHWRPRFIDYLYLGFTNATAFSPTDAMPLAPWAKITMARFATPATMIREARTARGRLGALTEAPESRLHLVHRSPSSPNSMPSQWQGRWGEAATSSSFSGSPAIWPR
jgi:hypothetical protein